MKHYVVGDYIRVNCCGDDMSSSSSGRVVHADKEHLIVRFEFYNQLAAYGLNRPAMTDIEVENIINKPIETFRKNEDDVFLDMKAPHTHLPIDRFEGGDTWAPVWMEEMFWDNVVFDEPVNGFTVVEKDGKFNFIDLDTDEYFSDVWFDKVINWTYKDLNKYTVVQYEGRCYAITKFRDDVLVTPLSPCHRLMTFEDAFGVKLPEPRIVIVDPHKTVCKIDDRWYLTSCIKDLFSTRMQPFYAKRYKGEHITMDKQWWYFLCTSNCAELSIGMYDGKYGLFPLMRQTGTQHGDYYTEDYPFIYDNIKVYDVKVNSDYGQERYGYIAVEENSKWGLFKLTGFPTMKMERIAASIYPDPETMIAELGIEIQEDPYEPVLREEEDR